jgi:hypothetical protein
VTVMPEQDNVAAKLSVEFDRESAFLVKANLAIIEMQNLKNVAGELAKKLSWWQRRFRIVSAVYIGRNCTIISSKAANSKIELSGSAKALKEFDLGSVTADVTASFSQSIGLEVVGKTGAVGLALFKLRWVGDIPKLLAEKEDGIETHDDWPATLPNDL